MYADMNDKYIEKTHQTNTHTHTNSPRGKNSFTATYVEYTHLRRLYVVVVVDDGIHIYAIFPSRKPRIVFYSHSLPVTLSKTTRKNSSIYPAKLTQI